MNIYMTGQNTTDTWLTPEWVTQDLCAVFPGVEYGDPCPGPVANHTLSTHRCSYPEVSGLDIDWWPNTFVNPPFSEMRKWVEKTIAEAHKGHNSLWFTKIDFRTKWGQQMANHAKSIHMVTGYVNFLSPVETENGTVLVAANSATFQTGFVTFSEDPEWIATVNQNLITHFGHRLVNLHT